MRGRMMNWVAASCSLPHRFVRHGGILDAAYLSVAIESVTVAVLAK